MADKPYATTLLEEALVIWRSADGAPHAMRDLRIHRGTALSLGWVSGDELVCGYHGWRYNAEGACTLIPQKANATVIPSKARIQCCKALRTPSSGRTSASSSHMSIQRRNG